MANDETFAFDATQPFSQLHEVNEDERETEEVADVNNTQMFESSQSVVRDGQNYIDAGYSATQQFAVPSYPEYQPTTTGLDSTFDATQPFDLHTTMHAEPSNSTQPFDVDEQDATLGLGVSNNAAEIYDQPQSPTFETQQFAVEEDPDDEIGASESADAPVSPVAVPMGQPPLTDDTPDEESPTSPLADAMVPQDEQDSSRPSSSPHTEDHSDTAQSQQSNAPKSPDEQQPTETDDGLDAPTSPLANQGDNDEETPESPPPQSPQYSDDSSDRSEQPQELATTDEQTSKSTEAEEKTSKRAIESDDDDDLTESTSPTKKRKRVILESDDEEGASDKNEDADGDDGGTTAAIGVASDAEESGGESAKNGDKEEDEKSEVGELIADIFGESDAENDDEDEQRRPTDDAPGVVDDSTATTTGGDDGDTDERSFNNRGMVEWDFDVMLARKKEETRKRKRRRRDGTHDLTSDADEQIKELIVEMKAAAKEDRHSNSERKLAIQKRKMLPFVLNQLKKADLREALVDLGIMGAISDWMTPLPDKSLPALEIRTELLKQLSEFPRLDHSTLRSSNIGKSVMILLKHPKETKENKMRASKVISEWARPIFNLEADYRTLSKEEREQRDYAHMPSAMKKRLSQDGESSQSKRSGAGDEGEPLRPGDPGWIGRARVPQPSTKDYIVRPKSNVDGFKADSRGKTKSQYDRKLREFKDKVKASKALRAVKISISGNKAL